MDPSFPICPGKGCASWTPDVCFGLEWELGTGSKIQAAACEFSAGLQAPHLHTGE